jgi:hypothetical protein
VNLSHVGASQASPVRPAGSKGRLDPPAFEVPTAPTPGDPEPAGLPAERPHGPAGAAARSNASDVAMLRRWINHPDLRGELPLPELTAEHSGRGFSKAVAAYEAAGGLTAPPPADPPVAGDPPVVTDPVGDVGEPA